MINVLAILFCVSAANAMNLPGLSPQDYRMNHRFDLMMSYIESDHIGTQFDYYDLNFCQRPRPASELYKMKNFGEALQVEHWLMSPYADAHGVVLGKNETCSALCTANYSPATAAKLEVVATRGYEYRLMIDDLPSAALFRTSKTSTQKNHPEILYDQGIKLAKWNPVTKNPEGGHGVASIYNHLELIIDYHKDSSSAYRIVGFDVEYKSVDWPAGQACSVPMEGRQEAHYKAGS